MPEETETQTESTSTTMDKVKTTAEVVVFAYVAFQTARGLSHLTMDWKDRIQEKLAERNANKEK